MLFPAVPPPSPRTPRQGISEFCVPGREREESPRPGSPHCAAPSKRSPVMTMKLIHVP